MYCYDLPSRHKKGTFAFTSGFIDKLPAPCRLPCWLSNKCPSNGQGSSQVIGSVPSLGCLDQRAKKVVSDSAGSVDFAIGLVNSVLNLPNEQVKYFEEFNLRKNCEIKLYA